MGVAVAVLGVSFIKYLYTQAKLLKGICVRNTTLEWREVLVNAIEAVVSGQQPQATIPLELEMVNSSDLQVTVKDISFNVFFDGTHIGEVNSQQESVLGANSVNELEIDIDLDLAGDLGDLVMSAIGGDNVIEVVGNIKIKASIYEEYNYPYQLKLQGSEILSETSGECEL